jgi:hypothetical protein
MYQVRELHGIPDKEYFQVISYQIPVSVISVEFYGKTSRTAQGFRRMAAMYNR